jgi:hypothetical protein
LVAIKSCFLKDTNFLVAGNVISTLVADWTSSLFNHFLNSIVGAAAAQKLKGAPIMAWITPASGVKFIPS